METPETPETPQTLHSPLETPPSPTIELRLTDTQLQIVAKPLETHIAVTGAPGTGKSFTLAARIAYCLSQGLPPSSILCISFSNTGRKRLKKLLERLCGLQAASDVAMETAASLAKRIVLEQAAGPVDSRFRYTVEYVDQEFLWDKWGDGSVPLSVVLQQRQAELLGELRGSKGMEGMEGKAEEKEGMEGIEGLEEKAEISEISEGKAEGIEISEEKTEALEISEEKAGKSEISEISEEKTENDNPQSHKPTEEYIKLLKTLNCATTDEVTAEAIKLLASQTSPLPPQFQYRIVLVDDLENFSRMHYQFLAEFLRSQKRLPVSSGLFIAGDADSNLYEWAGASAEWLTLLQTEVPLGAPFETFVLPENLRSEREIAVTTELLLRNDAKRHPRNVLYIQNSGSDSQSDSQSPRNSCKIVTTANEGAAVEFILQEAASLEATGKLKKREMAIAARTTAECKKIQAQMRVRGWKPTFLAPQPNNSAARLVLDFLSAIADPENTVALCRALLSVRRVGPVTVQRMLARLGPGETLWDHVNSGEHVVPSAKLGVAQCAAVIQEGRQIMAENAAEPEKALKKVLDLVVLQDTLSRKIGTGEQTKETLFAWDDIEELYKLAGSYVVAREQKKAAGVVVNSDILRGFLDDLSTGDVAWSENKIVLSTVHGLQSQEFKAVFIFNTTASKWPLIKLDSDTVNQESRLLAYAASRSSMPRQTPEEIRVDMSPFLNGPVSDFIPIEQIDGPSWLEIPQADLEVSNLQPPADIHSVAFTEEELAEHMRLAASLDGRAQLREVQQRSKFGVEVPSFKEQMQKAFDRLEGGKRQFHTSGGTQKSNCLAWGQTKQGVSVRETFGVSAGIPRTLRMPRMPRLNLKSLRPLSFLVSQRI